MEINHKEFEKFNLKVGVIKAVKEHPKTDDYIILIDIGKTGADKQVVADLKKSYLMEELIGKKILFLQNTEPVIVEGIESIGLIMVTSLAKKIVLLQPPEKSCAGAKIVGLNNIETGFHEEN